jgi:hypothetical protein
MSQTPATTTHPPSKRKDWIQDILQKTLTQIQKEENKKWFQMVVLDPVLTYILERIFPYILILTVLFFLLTVMITLTLVLVFMRLPGALNSITLS